MHEMRCDLLNITSKIAMLCRSGSIFQARKLFDDMPERDIIAWNAMISGYSRWGYFQDAFALFQQMRIISLRPDNYTFTAALAAASATSSLRDGNRLHSLIVVFGYRSSLPVNNALIDMYGKCLDPLSAGNLFNEMECTNDVSWCSLLNGYMNSGMFCVAMEVFDAIPKRTAVAGNTLISGLGRCGDVDSCLEVYQEMRKVPSSEPDHWTYSSLVGACTQFMKPFYGYTLHAIVIKASWCSFVEVKNSFLSFYGKFGHLEDAMKEFDSFKYATVISWNAAIDAYFKAGKTHEASVMFQLMPEKNSVSWTSMISGYAKHGLGEEAISFFAEMTRHGFVADEFTFGAAICACSSLPIMAVSKMLHGYAIRCGFHGYAYVGNGLVNMYAKSGDLESSIVSFQEIIHKDLISFNSLLFAFAWHGKADEALELFCHMTAAGTAPDAVTFVAMLMVCSHSGLIETVRWLLDTMKCVHEIPCDTVHVACVVDMLGRACYLEEAKQLVDEVSGCRSGFSHAISHETLLGACSLHGELGMGRSVHETLRASGEEEEMSFILQSNLCSECGEWERAEIVRKKMAGKGLMKAPGRSWIELDSQVTT